MLRMPEPWDYLIVTAANAIQAAAYEAQIQLRRRIGQLAEVGSVLVVADREGKRIGSGGSTVDCLRHVVDRERRDPSLSAEAILSRLRILIVHAGGDSRRLPAYSACGKIFVPLPGESYTALGSTLFDRIVRSFLSLPAGPRGAGQVVVTSGDALLTFDPASLQFSQIGMTVLGTYTTPEEAARHGVFCPDNNGAVRLFLQKPSVADQVIAGALDRRGQAVLDVGVMSFDASAAARILQSFCIMDGSMPWKPALEQAVLAHGIDLYREICCALGTQTTPELYRKAVRSSGGSLDDALLAELFVSLSPIPLRLEILRQCSFLHFGSTRQLISSAIALVTQDEGAVPVMTALAMNNDVKASGLIAGVDAWVEGCRVKAPLRLERRNVVVGVDVSEPLHLPEGACLDLSHGSDHQGKPMWFVRCYGVDDTFKHSLAEGATFCGRPLRDWMDAVGAAPADLWPSSLPEQEHTLWNARVFPVEPEQDAYLRWLWMFDAGHATPEQKRAFLAADRYSACEVATLVEQGEFHARRSSTRAAEIERSLRRLFATESSFSSRDLAFALESSEHPARLAASILALAYEHVAPKDGVAFEGFDFCRITHCLGSAIEDMAANDATELESLLPGLASELSADVKNWSDSLCLSLPHGRTARSWATRLKELAFQEIQDAILKSSLGNTDRPRNVLRPDETIWGRCPARIELAGGWTDTPPYTLEHDGEVTNTAINLNGQPPIHCYCRIIKDHVIRLNSIDSGQHLQLDTLEELLDYRRPGDPFALTKAALAISGFAPGMGDWPQEITLPEMLEAFGGGIEITTLVGIPQGSGLGTSSILGAVILGVINKMTGRSVGQKELFHDVLRLEQALTTGGGWQDQVGGCVGGSKITATRPGVFPDARIHYIPSDVLDPKLNGGCTLLYYTGLTRIAKNILQEVVGGYLNREHSVMNALAEEHLAARAVADSMSRKDLEEFGICVDAAWALQKRLCKTVTNPAIESLASRVRPFVYGMRISGAGSGGFLLMVCKSPKDAAHVREMLESEPLNERSRFFDFEVNNAGLEVTTC